MSRLNVWHEIPVNTSHRPIFVQDETELFSADHVGLYQGKSKLKALQNGRVYLTTQRVIFLDSVRPSAVGIYLRLLVRAECIEKFLRRSPKVKLYLREEVAQTETAPLISDWVCTVCSFNNHFRCQGGELPKCVACGISASAAQVAAMQEQRLEPADIPKAAAGHCPKCTFHNHPSLRFCEMCGAPLKAPTAGAYVQEAPKNLQLEEPEAYTDDKAYVKISFRHGGHRQFYELAQQELDRQNWHDLHQKGGVNQQAVKLGGESSGGAKVLQGGISAIEKSDEMKRLNNERVLSSSLNDLEQLMYKAQDVLQLTQNFSGLVKKRHFGNAILGSLAENDSPAELARNVSEFLVNYELTRPTSMCTVQDAFASYNRYRMARQGFGGQLVAMEQWHACIKLFDKMQLPVKTKRFQSGLTVLAQKRNSDNEIHRSILHYLLAEEDRFMVEKFQLEYEADGGYSQDEFDYVQAQHGWFHGRTVVDFAEHFGWATSVCAEELDGCLGEALLVQDKHISGTFYHVNKFDASIAARLTDHQVLRERARENVLSQQSGIAADLKHQYTSGPVLVQEYDYGADHSPPPASVQYSESLMQLDGLKFD